MQRWDFCRRRRYQSDERIDVHRAVLVATLIAAAVMRTAGGREPDGIRLADAVQTTGWA